MMPLYPRILGEAWSELPECVRRAHAGVRESRCLGSFDVAWGERAFARWLVRLAGVPREGKGILTELTVTPENDGGETWWRRFDRDDFVTRQWEEDGLLVERMGALELRFGLAVQAGELLFQQTGASLRLGPLSFRLPDRLSPRVTASVWEDGGMRVRVEVSLPGVGLLCRYEGSLWPERSP